MFVSKIKIIQLKKSTSYTGRNLEPLQDIWLVFMAQKEIIFRVKEFVKR